MSQESNTDDWRMSEINVMRLSQRIETGAVVGDELNLLQLVKDLNATTKALKADNARMQVKLSKSERKERKADLRVRKKENEISSLRSEINQLKDELTLAKEDNHKIKEVADILTMELKERNVCVYIYIYNTYI